MKFLYFLEGLRTPFLDGFFSAITHLGEETFFLVIAIAFFWCINKREGYFILITGLIGTVFNQFLKLAFKIPRPWVKDPSFTIVESARNEAVGYSFPSGHTQNVAGTFGCIGRWYKNLYIRIGCAVLILLVSLSRMYLGVHTPLDVTVSLGIAALLVFGLYPFFATEARFKKSMPYIVIASTLISVGLLLYAFLVSEAGVDAHNLYSARKNGSTLIGCTAGLILVYFIDTKFINFKTEAKWYSQIIKLALGLGGVLAIKAGLSSPLVSLFGNEFVARAVRYFLVVAFAGLAWPLTFKFFARLRIPFLDKLFH